MQEYLPDIYGYKLRKQFIFKDFSALFSELHQDGQTPEWWREAFLTNGEIWFSALMVGGLGLAVGAITGGAVALAVALGGGSSGGLSIGTIITKDADAATLLQTALIILLHERLCWLGITEISSKEFLARAAVDVLRLSPEVNADIKGRLGWVSNDYEAILADVIPRFRDRTVFV